MAGMQEPCGGEVGLGLHRPGLFGTELPELCPEMQNFCVKNQWLLWSSLPVGLQRRTSRHRETAVSASSIPTCYCLSLQPSLFQ